MCFPPFPLALSCTFAVLYVLFRVSPDAAQLCVTLFFRLCAWTKAGVISMGYIFIFIAVILIFACLYDTTAPDSCGGFG